MNLQILRIIYLPGIWYASCKVTPLTPILKLGGGVGGGDLLCRLNCIGYKWGIVRCTRGTTHPIAFQKFHGLFISPIDRADYMKQFYSVFYDSNSFAPFWGKSNLSLILYLACCFTALVLWFKICVSYPPGCLCRAGGQQPRVCRLVVVHTGDRSVSCVPPLTVAVLQIIFVHHFCNMSN